MNSLAHDQHGYSSANDEIKFRAARWVEGGAVSGYVAAMVWRRVHVLEPRASTSGGHGIVAVFDVDVDVDVDVEDCGCDDGGDTVAAVVVVVDPEPVCDFVMDAHAAKELHDRHLRNSKKKK